MFCSGIIPVKGKTLLQMFLSLLYRLVECRQTCKWGRAYLDRKMESYDKLIGRVIDEVTELHRASGLHDKMRRTQEAKNRPTIPVQEKFHRGILRGLINIAETP